MGQIIRIGVDTSKSVFQLHGVDEAEQPVLRRKLRRRDVLTFFSNLPPTRIGMEACGASHYWARELRALGHEVVLIPPQYVKPYVDRGKNDAADAEAICEAMSRPKVEKRFVAVKTVEQQARQMLIGVREGLLERRTQVSNTMRGYAAEFELVAPKGLAQLERLIARIEEDRTLPELVREMFAMLVGQYRHASAQVKEIEARLMAVQPAQPQAGQGADDRSGDCGDAHRQRRRSQGLSLGPRFLRLARADAQRSLHRRQGEAGRDHPRRRRDAPIAVHLRRNRRHPAGLARQDRRSAWLVSLVKRKPPKLAAVALANKAARIAWKMMATGEPYDPRRHDAPDQAGADALAEAA